MSPRAWQSAWIYVIALVVISSAFYDSPWGRHWVFIAVYALALLIAIYSQMRLTSLMLVSLIWLRYNLAEEIDGWQLKLSSAMFAVFLLFLVVAIGDRHRAEKRAQEPMG